MPIRAICSASRERWKICSRDARSRSESGRFEVLQHQLHGLGAVPFVDIDAKRGMDAIRRSVGKPVGEIELDRVEALIALLQLELEVLVFQDALVEDLEAVGKQRRGESLAPDAAWPPSPARRADAGRLSNGRKP